MHSGTDTTLMSKSLARRHRNSWFRLLPVLLVASIGSFVLGTRFVHTPGRQVHPVTSRAIPGIATDARWMDRPTSEREEAPDHALQILGLIPGMIVADVGAGSGYMTTRMARLLAPTGIVYANEIQPAMLQVIEAKATAEHLDN